MKAVQPAIIFTRCIMIGWMGGSGNHDEKEKRKQKRKLSDLYIYQ